MRFIKLAEDIVPKVWGREIIFSNKEIEDVLNKKAPLLIKIIETNQDLSYQVHPSKESYEELGEVGTKNEAWYVLNSAPDSKIGLGVKIDDKKLLRECFENGKVDEIVNYYNIWKNDFVYIESGTLHMLGKNMEVLEVQQNNDITYRVYDYGRGREMHLDQGMLSLNTRNNSKIKVGSNIDFENENFIMHKQNIKGKQEIDVSGHKYCYIVPLSGDGRIVVDGTEYVLEPKKCYYLEADVVTLIGRCEIMFVYEKESD
ncbi:MAG: class I mannose-6-phosphate isomerase [Clostridia bacterium]|nr:class I mannose-6-phosphate isomerase [Clostridia bacterium]